MSAEIPPLPLPAPSREGMQIALRRLEDACSELKTIADILCSLTDLTAGQASSCEFALMAQFLTERTATIEGIYDVMCDSLDDEP